MRVRASYSFLILTLAACGGSTDDKSSQLLAPSAGAGGVSGASSSGGSRPTPACPPGKQDACACPGGTKGVQRCRSDGSGYEACLCGEGPKGGAGGTKGKGGAGGSKANTGGKGGSESSGAGGEGGEAGAGDGGAAGAESAGAGGETDAGQAGAAGTGEAGAGGENNAGSGGAPAGGGGTAAGGPSAGAGGSGLPNDLDGDGFSPADGDCNDADPLVGPGAFDAPGDGVDNDCDGTTDPPAKVCDEDLGPAGTSPAGAARAIGLCQIKLGGSGGAGGGPAGRRPGVIDARFSDISGAFLTAPPKATASTNLQVGFLPSLGEATKPYEGQRFLALSSGIARAPGQAGAPTGGACKASKEWGSKSVYPPGFPKQGNCGTSGDPKDGMAVDLAIRVPVNAKSFSFKFRFFTCEYPDFTCSSFNDVFAVLMSPSPLAAGDPMADAETGTANVAFDVNASGQKTVIGVNNTSFLSACDKNAQATSYVNCAGDAALVGSGFDDHAASGWLQSTVSVPVFAPGADRVIALRFAIWDSSDAVLDSTAIIDDFQWSTTDGGGATTVVLPPK